MIPKIDIVLERKMTASKGGIVYYDGNLWEDLSPSSIIAGIEAYLILPICPPGYNKSNLKSQVLQKA